MDDQGAGSINSCAGLVSICAECAGGLKMINELTNYVVNETTIRLEHDKANEIVTFYMNYKDQAVFELTGYSTYPLNEQITDFRDLFQSALDGMEKPL